MQSKNIVQENASIVNAGNLVDLGDELDNLVEQNAYARQSRGQFDREVLEMDARILATGRLYKQAQARAGF